LKFLITYGFVNDSNPCESFTPYFIKKHYQKAL